MAGTVALRSDPESPAEANRRVVRALRRQTEAAQQVAMRVADAQRREAEARSVREAEQAAALARAIEEQDAIVFSVLDPEKLAREPKRIVARIEADFRVPVGSIMGRCGARTVVRARWAAIAAIRAAHPTYSQARLGRLFGRDHTTIRHALLAMAERGVPQPPARPARRSEA